MKDQSLSDRIYKYLLAWKNKDENVWIHKGTLEDLAKKAGFLGETCDRRTRELCEDGLVESRPVGKSQEYRATF